MAESITLTPNTYGKLGIIHCGVLHDLTASCAGDLHKLDDGEKYTFERARVTVSRNGEEFTFTKQ